MPPLQVLNSNAPRRSSAPKARPSRAVKSRAASRNDDLPFSLDVMLEILKLCSPYEIALFTTLSRQFRAFIAANPRVWEHACQNFARGECPALPTRPVIDEDLPGNFSWLAYVMWIFGPKACTICKRSSDSVSIHVQNWALKLYTCIDSELHEPLVKGPDGDKISWCEYHLKRDIMQYAYEEELWRRSSVSSTVGPQWIYVGPCMYRLNPASEAVDRKTLKVQKRMTESFLLRKNASDIREWASSCSSVEHRVARYNAQFIEYVVKENKLPLKCIALSETLKRVLSAFKRDIECITLSVWEHHRPQILLEAHAMRDGPMKRCDYCSKSFTTKDMLAHVIHAHENKDVPVLHLPDRRSNCIRCPKSTRFYTEEERDHHRLTKHGLEPLLGAGSGLGDYYYFIV